MPEEPFVPGVDPGLKAWLKMRQDVRDARSKGTNTYTITSEIPYKYHYHWIDLLFSFEEEEFRRLLISNSVSEHSWNKVNTHNICTNDEFEKMLLMSPRDKEKLYYSAIYHRSLVLLTNLIEREGMNINYRFTNMKRTLLQLAVQHGDLLKVAYLLQHHAKVTLKDIHQRTALHLAMQSELTFHPVDIPRMLIEAGATVNVRDEHGRTPLHYACLVGSSRLVRILLDNGADMTIEDEKKKTPLNYSSNHAVQEVFAEFSMFHGRKQQYLKVLARTVATRFISDIFQVVQPKCPVCKRTLSNCKSLKFSDYRYWMHAHGRFKKEMYKPKVKSI